MLVPMLRAVAAAKLRNKDGKGAVEALERALEIVEKHHGYVAPLLGDLQEDLGLALSALGSHKDALKAHDDALLPLEAMYGMTHPKVVTNLVRRGDLAHRLGDEPYAKQMWGAALPDLEARLGAADPTVVRLRKSLGK